MSDIDLTVLLPAPPTTVYRTWFADGAGQLHVSAGFKVLGAWLAAGSQPARWSFGFPTEVIVKILWSTPEGRTLIPDPPNITQPASDPELEDFVEFAVKIKRCFALGDDLGARFNAQLMACAAPTLLIPLNAERRVHDPRDALDAALSLVVAPAHYREDMAVCLGLAARPLEEFAETSKRFPREMLECIARNKLDVGTQPWLADYLADGTLLGLVK